MKVRVHAATYQDKGDGTFTVDVTYTRPINPGEPDTDTRRTDCRDKPNAAFTSSDVLALYRALFAGHDVEVAT